MSSLSTRRLASHLPSVSLPLSLLAALSYTLRTRIINLYSACFIQYMSNIDTDTDCWYFDLVMMMSDVYSDVPSHFVLF